MRLASTLVNDDGSIRFEILGPVSLPDHFLPKLMGGCGLDLAEYPPRQDTWRAVGVKGISQV